jgi:hypothetical protein
MVHQDGSGSLNPAFIQIGEPSFPLKEANAAIQLLGPNGELVGNMPFNVDFLVDPEEPFSTTYFNLRVPVPDASVAKIVLLYNGKTLDEITVSANTPTVQVNQPTLAGQAIPASGVTTVGSLLTLSWTASDADGDPLSFTILYSNDEGNNWYPIASNVTGNSYEVDTSALPGGEGGIFRVIVTDGANTNEADSQTPVSLPNNPPVVVVSGPRVVPVGTMVSLMGEANDAEDGTLADDVFVWSEGADGLGTGKNLNTLLDFGYHDVVLSVTDSDDNTTQVAYRVFVREQIFLPSVMR